MGNWKEHLITLVRRLWCGKIQAQVVESTMVVWEDLGSSPTYANCVKFNYYLLSCVLNVWDIISFNNMRVITRNMEWFMKTWESEGESWSVAWFVLSTLMCVLVLFMKTIACIEEIPLFTVQTHV